MTFLTPAIERVFAIAALAASGLSSLPRRLTTPSTTSTSILSAFLPISVRRRVFTFISSATFFTEGKDTQGPSFGNYDLGGSVAVNFNRYVGVEGEVAERHDIQARRAQGRRHPDRSGHHHGRDHLQDPKNRG